MRTLEEEVAFLVRGQVQQKSSGADWVPCITVVDRSERVVLLALVGQIVWWPSYKEGCRSVVCYANAINGTRSRRVIAFKTVVH